MKSKIQKGKELEKGKKLLDQSRVVLLIDFSRVSTADMRNLRLDLKQGGNSLLVIKKRLLGLLLKDRNVEFKNADFKMQVGAVFASDLENAASSVYKFFKGLEKDKKVEKADAKILGGYDVAARMFMPASQVNMIGQLPPREVLLAQLLGILAAPIRSFLYILQQKAGAEAKA